jgi:serine-type D-Ala-D-Ala carboxypeptidase (penicillin-binding protein 5/6)
VTKGQPIGKLKIWRNDNLVLEAPLTAAEDVGPGNMRQRAVDGATEFMIGLFKAGVGKL